MIIAALPLRGALIALPLTEPVGVEVEVDASLLIPADFSAALSARRFCCDAEGSMLFDAENVEIPSSMCVIFSAQVTRRGGECTYRRVSC